MISTLVLSQTHIEEMIRYVDEHLPLEACGLLAGTNHHVLKVLPVRNQAQSAVRFVMDPYEQLQVFEWIDAQGLELVGIFHSHPTGPETVSATDVAEAAYEVVHLIWSRSNGEWQARGFWIEQNRVTEVTVLVKDG